MSEGLQLILNDDGVFEEYDDTYDLTIHCENKEEREEVLNRLNWQWIPVSERLPEKNGNYLIQVNSSDGTAIITFMIVDHYNEDGTWLHCDNKTRKVIAWMPLPEPYKAESEEKK